MASLASLIEKFLDYIRYEKGFSRNTLTAYTGDFSDLVGFLSSQKIFDTDAVDYQVLHRYVVSLGKTGAKQSTIERKVSAVKSFYRFLVRKKLVEKNPAALLSLPKKEKRLPTVLEKSEILELLESMSGDGAFEARNKAMIVLLYAGGLRVSELTGLDTGDVDYKEGTVRVMGKGGKERVVPVGDFARKELMKYLGYRRELASGKGPGALFVTKSGARIQDRMVRYVINRYIRGLAIQKNVHPHTLRHTFATHLLQNGAGIRVIQDLLGHENLSTTQIYSHLTIDNLKKSYKEHHPHAGAD